MTIDTVELYRRATDEFAARMRRVGGRWTAATPCTDWDVRALVRHVVEEELWAPPIFAGRTIADIGDSLSGDPLGDDPARRFEDASAAAVEAVRGPGAMKRTVHLSFGDVPGSEYAMQLAADHLIHAWDLARALGTDPTLDAESAAAVRTWLQRIGRRRTDPLEPSAPGCRCRMGPRRRTSCSPGSGGRRDVVCEGRAAH